MKFTIRPRMFSQLSALATLGMTVCLAIGHWKPKLYYGTFLCAGIIVGSVILFILGRYEEEDEEREIR